MQPFPQNINSTPDSLLDALQDISRKRQEDITDRNNFPRIFLLGRKVGKVPSASNDVVATDRVGDFNVTASYAYYLIDNAGTAAWRRVAVASW